MEATHIHLIINHIPVLFTPVALILLLWGWASHNTSYIKLSMWGFIIAGLAAYIAFESGEGAEETVERLGGVGEEFIHEHEEMAEWSLWTSIVLGVIAIGGLYLDKMKPIVKRSIMVVLVVLSVLSSGLVSYTAYLGGQIRHSEIRPQQTEVQQTGGDAETENDVKEQ